MEDSVKARLIRFIDSKGLSKNKFEEICGLSKRYVSNISVSIQPDKVKKISLMFPDLNTGWLLTGDGEMLLQSTKGKIPLYDDVTSVGGYNDIVANVENEGRTTEWIDAGDWFPSATSAIHHYGDSMVEYPSGCVLVLKRVNDPRLLINGENYVIETDEFRITKQIQDDGEDYIMAYSSNRETYPDGHLIHSPIKIPKESIRHLDLVLGCVIKKFSNPVRIK